MAHQLRKPTPLVLWLMVIVFGLASQTAYAETCDADANGAVDFKDIFAIQVLSNGQLSTGASDPKDADRNGIINKNDVRICTTRCTPLGCPGLENRRPRAVNDSATTTVNQPVTIDLVANDRDFDGRLALSKLRIVTKPRRGRVINHRNGTVTYRPNSSFLGSDTFRYEIKDNQGAVSNVARVRVTLSNPPPPSGNNPISGNNLPPVANAGADISAATNTAVILNGSGSSDPEGGQLTFSWQVLSAPAGSTATIANNQSPTPNFTPNVDGVYELVLTVSDGVNASTDTVLVTATTANVPPNVILNTPNPQAALVGFPVQPEISFTVTDNDGPTNPPILSWTFVQPLPGGSTLTNASINNPTPTSASFTPDVLGSYTLALEADDGLAKTLGQVTVTAQNNVAPISNAGADITVPFPLPAVPPGNIVVLDGSGSIDTVVGPDDPLNYTWSFINVPSVPTVPAPGSALTNNNITNRLTATPSFIPDSLGEYTISLEVNDGDPAFTPNPTLDNVIVKANAAPVANADTYTATRDTDLIVPALSGVKANDIDLNLDALTIVKETDPTNGTLTALDVNDGSFTYKPNPGYEGPDSFRYRVNDGSNILDPYVSNAISAPATVTINVEPPNSPPVLTASGAIPIFIENGPPVVAVAIDGGITVTDPDVTDTNLESATVTINNPQNGAAEVLAATACGGLTVAPGLNSLNITGSQPIATYQTCLRSVTYSNSSQNPNTTTRIIAFTANDGTATSNPALVNLTVNAVNDRPSFTAANPPAVNEDAGTQVVPSWVTNFDPGHPDESTQAVDSYAVSAVGTPTLFAVPPTVDASGTLSYTPAPNVFGTSTFQVTVRDNGGTANGGVDTSVAQTFTITVNAVNNAPSFTAIDPPAINEDAGAQTVNGWATFNPGNTQENTQTVSGYTVSNVSNGGLFSSLPSVSTAGVLTYTPAPNANGTSTFQVAVQDNGGTANGGINTSGVQTFTITVNPVNDPPVARAPDPNYTGNANLTFTMANDGGDGVNGVLDLLDGATDPDGAAITVVAGTFITTRGGSVTLSSDGSFSYLPPAGFVGSDSFSYQIRDNGIPLPDRSTDVNATINVSDLDGAGAGNSVLWFIDEDNTASSNIGTQANPFRSLAAFNAANTGTGNNPADTDVIFLNDDSGADNNGDGAGTYGGGITLRANQRLIGDGSTSTLAAISGINLGSFNSLIPFSGIDPTVAGGIALNSGNTLRGVIGGNVNGFSISGGAVGSLTISESAINNTAGGGINVSTSGALNVSLDSLTSTGGTNGINLIGTSGSFTANGGTVTNPTGAAFNISGGNVSATYAGNITKNNNASTAINMVNNTGGTVTFSGASKSFSTATAAAVNLATNAGATINFTGGGLNIATTSGTGFNATGGAAVVNVTGSGNIITSTTGTALNVANTTIGALGLNFQRISSNGGSANGIILDSTGTSGGLTVTGDGVNTSLGGNSSGGIIANKSGVDANFATQGTGIYLHNTSNVVLRRMTVNGTNENYGIRGLLVNNFTLEYSTVGGTNGNVVTASPPNNAGEGSVYFGGNELNGGENGLTGSATVTGLNVSGGRSRNFSVINISGTLNRITISNSAFGLTQNISGGGQSLALEARQAGTVLNATVTGSSFLGSASDQANFTGQQQTSMDVIFGGTTTTPGTAPGNALSNSHAQNIIGGGSLNFSSNGTMTFNARGNTLRDAHGSAVTFFKAGSSDGSTPSLRGIFDNNIIGVAGVTNSGSGNTSGSVPGSGNGIFVSAGGTGTMSYTITNNQIHQINGNAHIYADNTGGSYTANFTILNNILDTPSTGWFAGIAVTNGSPTSTDTINVCADIGGAAGERNTLNLSGALGIIVGSSGANGGHTFNLPGYTGGANLTNVEGFLADNNNGSFTTDAYADAPTTAAAFTGIGTSCPTP